MEEGRYRDSSLTASILFSSELIWQQSHVVYMQANTFDVIERRKHITFFKLGKLWIFKETANDRIFLMKDLAAVEEAVGLGAKIYEGENPF